VEPSRLTLSVPEPDRLRDRPADQLQARHWRDAIGAQHLQARLETRQRDLRGMGIEL
jgi:hypothetical protein